MSEVRKKDASEIPKEEGIKVFDETMTLLKGYNGQYGPYATLARSMLRDMGEPSQGATEKETVEAMRRHEDRARSIGLGFAFDGTPGMAVAINFKTTESGEVGDVEQPRQSTLVVVDGQAFLGFLEKLDGLDLKTSKPLAENIQEGVKMLIREMAANYHPGKENDARWTGVLSNARGLVEQFRRLGFGDDTKRLDVYLANYERNTLGEYLLLEKAKVFEPPEAETYGPGQWHRDAGPEEYRRLWEGVEKAIETCRGDERTAPLVKQALENLIRCTQYVIVDAKEMIAAAEPGNRYRSVVLPQHLKVAQELGEKFEALLMTFSKKPTGARYD